MTIVVFTDAGGVPWKVWKVATRLVFHAKTGAKRSLRLEGCELPALELLQEQPRTLEALCRQAESESRSTGEGPKV